MQTMSSSLDTLTALSASQIDSHIAALAAENRMLEGIARALDDLEALDDDSDFLYQFTAPLEI